MLFDQRISYIFILAIYFFSSLTSTFVLFFSSLSLPSLRSLVHCSNQLPNIYQFEVAPLNLIPFFQCYTLTTKPTRTAFQSCLSLPKQLPLLNLHWYYLILFSNCIIHICFTIFSIPTCSPPLYPIASYPQNTQPKFLFSVEPQYTIFTVRVFTQ